MRLSPRGNSASFFPSLRLPFSHHEVHVADMDAALIYIYKARYFASLLCRRHALDQEALRALTV